MAPGQNSSERIEGPLTPELAEKRDALLQVGWDCETVDYLMQRVLAQKITLERLDGFIALREPTKALQDKLEIIILKACLDFPNNSRPESLPFHVIPGGPGGVRDKLKGIFSDFSDQKKPVKGKDFQSRLELFPTDIEKYPPKRHLSTEAKLELTAKESAFIALLEAQFKAAPLEGIDWADVQKALEADPFALFVMATFGGISDAREVVLKGEENGAFVFEVRSPDGKTSLLQQKFAKV